MKYIQNYLQDNNPTPWMNAVLIQVFGTNLVLFNETLLEVDTLQQAVDHVYVPVINAFLFMINKK